MRMNRALLLLIVALIAGGLLVLYLNFHDKEAERKPAFHQEGPEEMKEIREGPVTAKEPTTMAPQEKLEEILGEKEVEGQAMTLENECQKTEKDLMSFFTYLEQKDYIRDLALEEDLFSHFQGILRTLSLDPPLPAGEGFSYDMIIQNIYHFYRILGLKDLKLIKSIADNEADSMEVNLALFYKWLMSGERCGGRDGLPPKLDTLYRYAGYLINSIGGRAYLFRRETRLRLLVHYYCILIIHEADRRKLNNFGIDITPYLEPLADEMENYQLLYFRREYAGKLIDLKNYYLKRRSTS
jgi:hypothetical protein